VHTPLEKREEAIFEIVNQLNRGVALITSREERDQIAELNLIAGRRAKASTAYISALNYLTAGVSLLAEDSWERRHELIFALELHTSECEFLTGRPAAAAETPGDAFVPRGKHGRTSRCRMLAHRCVHGSRAERSCCCGLPRLPPASRCRLVA
jgi:hypothetical protein